MKRRPKTSTLVVIAAIVVLAVLLTVLAAANAARVKRVSAGLPTDAFHLVTSTGTTTVTREELMKLPLQKVTVTLDTSTTSAKKKVYAGLPLRELFKDLDMPFSADNYSIASGSDGFTMTYLADEIQAGKVWLVLQEDGKALPGRAQGGFGPFLIVTQGEQFSLRWCKYLQTLTVK